MPIDFKQVAIGAAIVLGGVGIYSIATSLQKAKSPPVEKPYLYLKVSDCPSPRGFVAIFRDGEVRDGLWTMRVASETVRVKPPAACWQVGPQPLPAKYNGGDKFRWLPDATPSAKAAK